MLPEWKMQACGDEMVAMNKASKHGPLVQTRVHMTLTNPHLRGHRQAWLNVSKIRTQYLHK